MGMAMLKKWLLCVCFGLMSLCGGELGAELPHFKWFSSNCWLLATLQLVRQIVPISQYLGAQLAKNKLPNNSFFKEYAQLLGEVHRREKRGDFEYDYAKELESLRAMMPEQFKCGSADAYVAVSNFLRVDTPLMADNDQAADELGKFFSQWIRDTATSFTTEIDVKKNNKHFILSRNYEQLLPYVWVFQDLGNYKEFSPYIPLTLTIELSKSNVSTEYELIGVIVHEEKYHSTALIKDQSDPLHRWWHADDYRHNYALVAGQEDEVNGPWPKMIGGRPCYPQVLLYKEISPLGALAQSLAQLSA